ncbi:MULTISPECIES: GNAT family N-acetyltransferase, partial [Dorea]
MYLYVDEYYRQKGIGKHLLSEAKNTAKQLGYTKISLYFP